MSESKQQLYSKCCEPLHKGIVQAETAEQLMRSRYAAFVLQDSDYIVRTTLPAQQKFLDKDAIADWARKTQWAGLEVLNHKPKVGNRLGKRHAQVEFKAYYHTDEGIGAHHELSTFIKVEDCKKSECWYFLDPTTQMRLTQKQPCICGSGEKYKRCCGAFI